MAIGTVNNNNVNGEFSISEYEMSDSASAGIEVPEYGARPIQTP